MADKCKSSFIGNLADDPKEIPVKKEGGKMASLRLVTNTYRGKDNPEMTQGHSIVAYGNDAEFLLKYAKKGDRMSADCLITTTVKGEGDAAEYFTNHEVQDFDLFGKRQKEQKDG